MATRKVWINAVNQPFFCDFKVSLSTLIGYKMYLLKPTGVEVEKTNVTISGTKLLWKSEAGDFDTAGMYSLQPWIDDGSFQGRREPLVFEVLEYQETGER